MRYDGLGRRIVKQAGDGDGLTREVGDFEPQAPPGPEAPLGMACHLYHDGRRIVLVSPGGSNSLCEFAASWGVPDTQPVRAGHG